MFDKFKQLGDLKKMKEILEKEQKTIEKEGIVVVVNGKMEIEEIKLNDQLSSERQAEIVKDCINEGFKGIQMEAAKKIFSQNEAS